VWRINGLPNQWTNQPLDIFPEPTGLIAPGSPWTQAWASDGSATWEARTPVHAFRSESPRRIGLVLATANTQDGQPASAGVALDADFEGEWPAVKPPTPINPKLAAMLQAQLNPPPQPDTSLGTWLLALVGAFVGGLILNLMPCVFPVLALKVLAFAEQPAGADLAQVKQAHRTNGLSYTLGVVLSFGALGGALLALRGAGELLGWGFQLQNPWLVAGLAWLFTVIALNLFGLFEMRLWLPQRALAMRVNNPQVDAFLSGVLATAVASPCTAPFMGASLGLAIALPTAQAMAVFFKCWFGHGQPLLVSQLGARRSEPLTAPRGMDGDVQATHGLPHAGHRGVVALGLWSADQPQRRGSAVAVVARLRVADMDMGANGHPHSPNSLAHCGHRCVGACQPRVHQPVGDIV
jgi:cytochrome c biogenesis protein CcdA